MPSETITLEKVYRKLERLENPVAELRHSILPFERLSKKEITELNRSRSEMRKGNFITAKKAISILEK
ncbi:MAG: hypothetical protein AABW99_02870 [archaeon]